MEKLKFIYYSEGDMLVGYLEEYPDYMTQGVDLDELKKNLTKHEILENTTIIAATTNDASKTVEGLFDMVFVDADHSYEAVRQDIDNWLPKVKKGGIIAGHDYLWAGPRKAANEIFTDLHVMNNVWSTKV